MDGVKIVSKITGMFARGKFSDCHLAAVVRGRLPLRCSAATGVAAASGRCSVASTHHPYDDAVSRPCCSTAAAVVQWMSTRLFWTSASGDRVW